MRALHFFRSTQPLLRRARRGSNAMIVSSSILSASGFAALALDIGFLSSARTQLQAVADVTARAGAARLNGTPEGMDAAEATAEAVATANEVWGEAVSMAGTTLTFGVWDVDNADFTVSDDATQVNAIQVDAALTALPTFFAGLAFGQYSMGTAATSTAVVRPGGGTPAGAVDCYIPLAVPKCMIEGNDADTLQDLDLKLSPAGQDTTGWALIGAGANASNVRDQIDSITGSSCAGGEVGDTVNLNNGVQDTQLQGLDAIIEGGGNGVWDDAVWGTKPTQWAQSRISTASYNANYVISGPILVIDVGSDYCTGSGGNWTGTASLSGFVWGAVYDVGSGPNKNIRMRIDVSTQRPIGTAGGGEVDGGITFTEPGGSYTVR